jgi:hypothetical protein
MNKIKEHSNYWTDLIKEKPITIKEHLYGTDFDYIEYSYCLHNKTIKLCFYEDFFYIVVDNKTEEVLYYENNIKAIFEEEIKTTGLTIKKLGNEEDLT